MLELHWSGPCVYGVSVNMLSKYLVCKERFRLLVVYGLQDKRDFDYKIEYGSLFAECNEYFRAGKNWLQGAAKYLRHLRETYPGNEKDITDWYKLLRMQFPLYVARWKGNREYGKFIPVLQEQEFLVPYKLPSGRVIYLRGRIDSMQRTPKWSLYLEEDKTKGYIDDIGIQTTLKLNLQTMFYQIALRTCYRGNGEFEFKPGEISTLSPKGVSPTIYGNIYNVIRRPLSNKKEPRQRKKETRDQFLERLGEFIKQNQGDYFKKWNVKITAKNVAHFQKHTFNPIMEGLCDWYEFIAAAPDDCPFERQEELLSKDPSFTVIHNQTPFGVFNPLFGGFRGDYHTYLTTGSKRDLEELDYSRN